MNFSEFNQCRHRLGWQVNSFQIQIMKTKKRVCVSWKGHRGSTQESHPPFRGTLLSLSLWIAVRETTHSFQERGFPKDKSALPDKHSLGIHLTCRNDRPSRGTHIYFFRAGMLVSRRINSEQVGLGMAECEFMRPLAASMTVPSVSPEYDD